MQLNFFKIIFVFTVIINSIACTKDEKPNVGVTNKVIMTTTPIVSIGSDSAICGGSIISDGGDLITERGICWSTSTNPNVNQNSIKNGSGTGTFSNIIKPLLPNTNYYVRAYVNNVQGIIYGNLLSFITKAPPPTIQTNAVSSITQIGAIIGGSNINDFGSAITQKGICWSSTNTSPNLNNNVVLVGLGSSNFSINIQNFSPNTTYYARAFASNINGTGFGSSVQFKTLPALIPSITTNPITNVSRTIANCGGNISSDGGALITQRGICWSTSLNPTTSNTTTLDGAGIGSFLSQMTGLQPNQTYYVRAYAINSVGTAYGSPVLFTTLPNQLPSVTTSPILSITRISAQGGGNIIDDGGLIITQRGLCWSTQQNPTISNSKTINGTGAGSFSSSITGLLPGTIYYVRAYAINALGTSYGTQSAFMTSF